MTSLRSSPVLLYDVDTKGSMPWSPDVWQTRLAMNYKNVPHKSITVTGPLSDTLGPLGFKATQYNPARKENVFAVPSIMHTSKPGSQPVLLSSADVIAQYLESEYPSPSLIPDRRTQADLHQRHIEVMGFFQMGVVPSLAMLLVPSTVACVADDDTCTALQERYGAAFDGKDLKTLFKTGEERLRVWGAVQASFSQFAEMLDEMAYTRKVEQGADDSNSPYLLGGTSPTYADVFAMAYFQWMKATPVDRDQGITSYVEEIKTWNDGRWGKLIDALEPIAHVDA